MSSAGEVVLAESERERERERICVGVCLCVCFQIVGVSQSADLKHSPKRVKPCLGQAVIIGRARDSPGPFGTFLIVLVFGELAF